MEAMHVAWSGHEIVCERSGMMGESCHGFWSTCMLRTLLTVWSSRPPSDAVSQSALVLEHE